MNILDLDVYSLRLIMSMLDPSSYMNIMYTCKTFQIITSKCINTKTWMTVIQQKLVKLSSSIVDRDDVYETHTSCCLLATTLKAFVHTLKMINFIRNYEIYSNTISENICKLLVSSAESVNLHSSHLITISRILSIEVSHWFTFENTSGLSVIVCNMVNTLHCLFIIIDEKEKEIKYFYNNGRSWVTIVMSHDAESKYKYKSELDGEDLMPIIYEKLCECLHCVKDITPSTVMSLSKFAFPVNDHVDTGNSSYKSQCKEVAEKKTIEKGRMINHMKGVFNTNLSKGSSLLPNAHFCSDMFSDFFRFLLIYSSITEYSVQQKYFANLIYFIGPFVKVLSRFAYGELLGYFPIVAKLLLCVDLTCNNVDPCEINNPVMLHMGCYEILINKEMCSKTYVTYVKDKIKFDLSFDGVLTDREDENLIELLQIFNDFVESNFSDAELRLIPEISVVFLKDFFYCLFSKICHLIVI